MADRRADDTPLAPRRSLSGPSHAAESNGDTGKRPLSDRVSTAVAAAGSAVQSATAATARPTTGESSRRPGTSGPRPSSGSSSPTPTRSTARPKGTRKARLRLVHLDPWSVMKTSFLLSIAFGIVTVVAVAVVMSVLGAAGVWDSINKTVGDVLGGDAAQTFDVQDYVGTSRVLGFTMIVAVVDVVLITAISTLGAFLYNLAAALLGGIEVTLAEDER
ncbi:MAG: DUF3566 domain-containing protein [Nocardioidaceae bacterium]